MLCLLVAEDSFSGAKDLVYLNLFHKEVTEFILLDRAPNVYNADKMGYV